MFYSVYGINHAAGRLPLNKGVGKNSDLLQIRIKYLQALSTPAIAVLAVTARTLGQTHTILSIVASITPPHRDGADPSTPAAKASVAAVDSAVL
jgi:hypothetical protein